MIITPLFCRLNKHITVSQKLGIQISNIEDTEKEYLLQQLVSEVSQYYEDNEKNLPPEYRDNRTIQEILFSNYYVDFFKSENTSSEIECLKSICNNILKIHINESNESVLSLKNEFTFNPTCEMSVEEKFTRLFSFLEYNMPYETKRAEIVIACNDNGYGFCAKTDIISYMNWRVVPHSLENNPYRFTSHSSECQHKIDSITAFGKSIDKYIISDKDFFVMDFIMDSLSSYDGYGTSRIIKLVAILELILAKTNKSLRQEFRNKLPQFLSDNIDNKELWITLMYDIRSKIAHGDYLELMRKTEKYAEVFMKDFEYDYYEYNKLNWIIPHLYGELSVVVARVVKTMLNCRPLIDKIKET